MIFNPNLTKQAQEMIFSRKSKNLLHPSLSFNNIPLKNSMSQKYLGLTLDLKPNFVECRFRSMVSISSLLTIQKQPSRVVCRKKCSENMLHIFRTPFPKNTSEELLPTIHKAFVRSQLDYADIIYDQGYNSSFHE